ncbi:hypothetical protein M1O52_03725 [Dehalococcoidia bacterium]|nr:hypothetical protein [Dehalococcoidia bacterium]MCL0095616.1 hypothetical protein [Dehalococcoidia bacterium]
MIGINLDKLAAETSHRIIKVVGERVKDDKQVAADDLDNLATKALGVMQEQGVYAGMLFLLSRSGGKSSVGELKPEEAVACRIVNELLKLLNAPDLSSLSLRIERAYSENLADVNKEKMEILKHFAEQVTADLYKLLTVRSLFEQVLTYVRYGAKAVTAAEGSAVEQAATGESRP